MSRIGKPREAENRLVVARGGEDWGMGREILSGVMKMFCNLIVVIVAQSVNLLQILNSTLKRVDFITWK